MEDKEQYTTEEIIKKFQSLLPHKKTLQMIADYNRVEGKKEIIKQLREEMFGGTFLGLKYKKQDEFTFDDVDRIVHGMRKSYIKRFDEFVTANIEEAKE